MISINRNVTEVRIGNEEERGRGDEFVCIEEVISIRRREMMKT